MTHLTMDALLALREPGSEPGSAAAREHLEGCEVRRAELERLHQRVARLKALPTLRPARDLWPAVAERKRTERRGRRARWIGGIGLGLAASVAFTLLVGPIDVRGGGVADSAPVSGEQALSEVKERSQLLESALDVYAPETRVLDGQTAHAAQLLEDRIAEVDRELQVVDLPAEAGRQRQTDEALSLWRERVGLLDALVDVHVTRASNVGL